MHKLSDENIDAAYATERRALLRCNAVMSLDGATIVDGSSRPLSTPTDLRVLKHLRDCADAVLVGAGTLRAENYPPLNPTTERRQERIARGLHPHPTLVVVTRSGEGLAALRAIRDAPVRPIILAPHTLSPQRREELRASCDVLLYGESDLDLAAAISELHARSLTHLLCEGGPELFGALLLTGLIDEWCVTISSALARNGSSLHNAQLSIPQHLRLKGVLTTPEEVFLRYTDDHKTPPKEAAA